MRRILVSLALAVGLSLALAACAPATVPIALDESTVVIDVRSSAEFASGHLEGAINIDVQSPDFDALVQQLDREGAYVVYCRSGNRSGQAIDRMRGLGFTDLVNAGSVQSAAESTALPVVTG
ncbi:hypothetical protein GCM10009792_17380 [Microcella alkalica]|uniref:Rhodanese-related sulfurtransferase n=1 Tax=Microcella alkalica TaxID=355930 RepID=A0A839EBD3_9MICO|nr:rhodanese-like domain-containing protein [Microcella alkalica]MBA8847554.1 rhodanese-related sulfurtransferase [Microcella alkalica]